MKRPQTRIDVVQWGLRLLSRLTFLLTLVASNTFAVDLILHNGKIVTVDDDFSVRQAIAVSGARIVRVGDDSEILTLREPGTEVIDLGGRMVLPGLIDSHVHPAAAMTEFDHEIPVMESIADVLDYIRRRAAVVDEGQWIFLRQVFITRLKEQRYPSRDELDEAAPRHPVNFSTGPDAMLNTQALERLGIDENFQVTDGGPGFVEVDPESGRPTGLLRGLNRLIQMDLPGKRPTAEDHYRRTVELFRDYNRAGLTTVADKASSDEAIERFREIYRRGDLTVRLAISRSVNPLQSQEALESEIRALAGHPLRAADPMLRLIGVKIHLDGGMLTGSAYMREPWGVSDLYGIRDPNYRGVLNVPREKLLPLVRSTLEAGLQFTAHTVGDGAVETLLSVYEELNRRTPVRPLRPSLTHSNFMSRELVEKAWKLGVVMDIQPAWLFLDGRTLAGHFGLPRLRYFQPLRTIFETGAIAGGGSDHMQKIGALRAVNPYDPFLGMWITLTRQPRWFEGTIHFEEALTREQAIRFYTLNNAYMLFLEEEVGSLDPGKRADLIVLDRDILTCSVDEIRGTRVLRTYLDGRLVFQDPDGGF